MTLPGPTPEPVAGGTRTLDGGFWLVIALAGACAVLVVVSLLGRAAAPAAPIASPSPDLVQAYLIPSAQAAPAIALTDQGSRPFRLTDLRGTPTFVFFGYTHCPDVCPATVGTIGLAMSAVGSNVRALFVTIDPERDTTAWLSEYLRFLPAGFVGLTGTASQIAETAGAWGVRYAKEETGVAGAYAMSHTADVFLVDGAGVLRARFPFGTTEDAMAATYRTVVADPVSPAPSVAPTPTVAATPSAASSSRPSGPLASSGAASPAVASPRSDDEGALPLDVAVVSSSIWSGPPGPVILTLSSGGVPVADPQLRPLVQLTSSDGRPVGPATEAVGVQPPGVAVVSYVATIPIPAAGSWGLAVTADTRAGAASGHATITALDPGATPPLGGPAPDAHTPTLDDAGGVARAVTTDPAPDLRLSRRSTTDALAGHLPFVLVIDSTRFRVSPACGRAIVMARYLLDRWPDVAFIHLEPYRYDVVTDTAVLEGSLDAPTLTDPAAAWGIGGAPWGARSMPWVFVVDGHGTVRAKYQGVVGSDEVDVIVSLVTQGG